MFYQHLQDCSSQDVKKISVAELNDEQKALRKQTHFCIKKVGDDIQRRNTFNTAISAIRELNNSISKYKLNTDAAVKANDLAVLREAYETSLLLLQPIVPHFCEYLLTAINHDTRNLLWPIYDESTQTQSKQEIVLQVNGKLRAKIETAVEISKEDLQALALQNEQVQKYLAGVSVRKVIIVPGKLVNIVAN